MRRGWRSPRSVGPVCRRRRSPSVSGRPEAGSRPFTRWRRLVCLAASQRESRLQGGDKKSDERSAAAQLLPPCLGSEPGTRGVRRFDFKPAAIRAAPHSMWPHPSIDGNAARRIRTPTSSGFGWGWAQCWRGPRTATRDELMHMEEPNGGGSAVSLISWKRGLEKDHHKEVETTDDF